MFELGIQRETNPGPYENLNNYLNYLTNSMLKGDGGWGFFRDVAFFGAILWPQLL